VLYVQLDNTSRENKNKYTMAYFNMLVQKKIFKKIKIGFLLVGHTHDQIDQMFSRISTKLNKQRAFRLESLEEIIIHSYKPRPEIIFVHDVADFKKFVSDKNQPNLEGVEGSVLLPLNGIRDQKQFRIKQVIGEDGVNDIQFHAKHLSSTKDWGESVRLVRYIPMATMWTAPQMALKSASGSGCEQHMDKELVGEHENDETLNNHVIVLAKYRKAIIDQGFTYFGDADKLWWIKFFEKQEEILQTYLEPAQWRFEWTSPKSSVDSPSSIVETQPHIEAHLLEKVAGPEKHMYSGRRKATPSFGDYRDLEVKTKFSMICVKAQGDPNGKPFWVAKVNEILTQVQSVPEKIKVTWYTVDSEDDALVGKYYPEKSKSSNRLLEDELCLSQTTVYAYNFALLGTKTLPAVTRRIIESALKDGGDDE